MLILCDYQSEALFQNVDTGLGTEFINIVLSWVEENSNLGYFLEKIVQFSFSPKIEQIIFSMLLWLHYVNEESQNMWP